MRKFNSSYHAIISLTLPRGGRHTEYPQLEWDLLRGFKVNILVAIIHRVLFGQDYAAPTPIAECVHFMKLEHDRHTMKEAENKSESVGFMRWIENYISPLDMDSSWVKRKGVIKKETLNFPINF